MPVGGEECMSVQSVQDRYFNLLEQRGIYPPPLDDIFVCIMLLLLVAQVCLFLNS